jgi:serine/threonine protein kinase
MVVAATSSARIGSYVLGAKIQSTKTFEVWRTEVVDSALVNGAAGTLIVKRLLPELAENPRLIEQYATRGERAKRLHHEGINRIVDVVVHGDECCVVGEPIDGQSLRTVLDRVQQCANSLPVWFAVHIARALSAALAHAHSGGVTGDPMNAVYHQDVAAENVFITEDGSVKLVDFGLSRAALLGVELGGTRRWSDSGEFDLWAPHYGDAQTDIQGLGRVFYELLTGSGPSKAWVPPSRHAPWVAADLDQIVARMLLPEDRFASVQALFEALDEVTNRQRQLVDSTHLLGLLHVVMLSVPPSAARAEGPVAESRDHDDERRSETILPAAPHAPKSRKMPKSLPEAIGRLESVLEAALDSEYGPPSAQPWSRRRSRHDWDAAVSSARRDSNPPPATIAVADEPELPARNTATQEVVNHDTATACFERGLDLLKQGEHLAAEAAWLRGLELDPNHRLCQVNLNLLRRLRDSQRPT